MSEHPTTPSRETPNHPSMPLDQARAIRWPFDDREPMGAMFDRGALSRSKLQWAAEKAKWPDVRRAAQVLLAELAQPHPSPSVPVDLPSVPADLRAGHHGPRVVTASDYLEDQEGFHGWLLAYYVGLGVGVFILTLNTIFWLLRGQALWITLLSIIANTGGWIWLLILIRRQREKVRTFRAGRKGEDQVVEQIRAAIDERWTIYRNLQLPDRKSDLDLVLVGPGGVWAVQVKATRAPLRVQGGRWQIQRGGRWVAAQPDPGAQVTSQATALNDFFKRNGFNRFVERAVALSDSQPFDQFEASEIPVWLPFDMEAKARALATRYPPSPDELARINALLGQRAVEQRAAEDARSTKR